MKLNHLVIDCTEGACETSESPRASVLQCNSRTCIRLGAQEHVGALKVSPKVPRSADLQIPQLQTFFALGCTWDPWPHPAADTTLRLQSLKVGTKPRGLSGSPGSDAEPSGVRAVEWKVYLLGPRHLHMYIYICKPNLYVYMYIRSH